MFFRKLLSGITFFVLVVLAVYFSPSANAAEIKLIDREVQFEYSDNGFHILKRQGENIPGVPVNWLSPNDFYNGEWHIRYHIINPPLGNSSGRFQVCIWNMPGFTPENCAGQTRHTGNQGSYFHSSTPASWWKKDGVPLNFSNSTPFLIRAVLRGENGCNVTRFNVTGACWNQWPLYEPMKFRLTIVMVSRGSTFSGWENYPAGDYPTVPPGPLPPGWSPYPDISPFPDIPKAKTDCKFECVWDTTHSPNCKVRQSSNLCGIDADSSKCESIDISYICSYASFDCPANSCEEKPIDRSVRKQDIYCNIDGDPTSDDSTGELYTAIGCISIDDTERFLGVVLPVVMSIAGGVAFLLILYASFMIKTSAGDPKRLQAGRELLTAALAGLILVVLAILLLRVVGQQILRLPEL